MKRENIVRMVAGTFVLISTLLAFFVNINWIWLGVFVGFNLLQSSMTKFCPLEKVLGAFNLGSCPFNSETKKNGEVKNVEKGF